MLIMIMMINMIIMHVNIHTHTYGDASIKRSAHLRAHL